MGFLVNFFLECPLTLETDLEKTNWKKEDTNKEDKRNGWKGTQRRVKGNTEGKKQTKKGSITETAGLCVGE